MDFLQSVSLPVLGLGIWAILLIGMELGLRLPGWLDRKRDHDDAGGAAPEYLLSATLGLLALLLGFTFSLALNRYEARRELVVQESNALGTAWLRAQLLQEPNRAAMSGLLRAYTDVRLRWSEDGTATPDLRPTAALQQKLWAALGTAIRTDPSQQLTRGLMDAMNDSFDLQSARTVARRAHIPNEVWAMLLLYSFLAAGMLGHLMSNRPRPHRAATMLLLTLVTLALVLILDVDRPRGGAIRVSQQPMEDFRASIG